MRAITRPLISYLAPIKTTIGINGSSSHRTWDVPIRSLHMSVPLWNNVGNNSNVQKAAPRLEPRSASSRLDELLSDAKRLLIVNDGGDASNYDLQNLITEEVSVISQILQKLVGTKGSLTEIKKFYQNDSFPEHFIRGLVVLLISKAACQDHWCKSENSKQFYRTQWRLAKIVEMIHMATIVHKQIHNVGFNRLDSIEAKNNLSNKISVLFGDFLWAKAWKELSDIGDMQVIDMMVSVLVNMSEGLFLSELESTNLASNLTLEYWLKKNFLLSACLPAFGCKSALKLAQIDERLQKNAYEFGRNFGLLHKAYCEIKWFNENDSVQSTIDLCSLPVIMHALEKGPGFIETIQRNEDLMDQIIGQGAGLTRSKAILDGFRQKSLDYLDSFPETEAKEYLKAILHAMDV